MSGGIWAQCREFHSCFWCRISTVGTIIARIQEENILDTMARVCVASHLSSAAQFIHTFPRWNSRLLAIVQTHSQKSQLRCKAWSAVSGIFDRYCPNILISCPCCRLIPSLRPLTAKSPVLSLIDSSLFHRLFFGTHKAQSAHQMRVHRSFQSPVRHISCVWVVCTFQGCVLEITCIRVYNASYVSPGGKSPGRDLALS